MIKERFVSGDELNEDDFDYNDFDEDVDDFDYDNLDDYFPDDMDDLD